VSLRRGPAEIAAAVPRQLMEREISRFSAEQRLWRQGSFDVLLFRAWQAPAVLFEIGRVRELTFRQVQEGTGRSADLDRFDEHYEHLLLWERERGEVAGAYRMVRTGPVLASHGPSGLYTQSLFNLKPGFFRELGPAVELGRSFVHPDYQRKPHSLALLWRGIGAYLDRHPECQALFGPVSISGSYSMAARRMLAAYFVAGASSDSLRPHVRARRPIARGAASRIATIEEIDELVRRMGGPAAERGIPVLLRQYLKLGGRVIDCSVDPAFGNCLDALIVVDLQRIDRDRVRRMLGSRGPGQHFAPAGCGASGGPPPAAATSA